MPTIWNFSAYRRSTLKWMHRALLDRLRDFLIKLGRVFCFVGSEYPLQVGGQDFALHHITGPVHGCPGAARAGHVGAMGESLELLVVLASVPAFRSSPRTASLICLTAPVIRRDDQGVLRPARIVLRDR